MSGRQAASASTSASPASKLTRTKPAETVAEAAATADDDASCMTMKTSKIVIMSIMG